MCRPDKCSIGRCVILTCMTTMTSAQVQALYAGFRTPIASVDCGQQCAPYNDGVPFCCDTCHAVPTAYLDEWAYLQDNTELWHLWEAEDPRETHRLKQEAGAPLVLVECLGHQHCQRDFRTLICRAFPFYPYIDARGMYLGLSYYWEYWERCWVISNLDRVSSAYRREFGVAFEKLFAFLPDAHRTFANYGAEVRQVFAQENSGIPLLHQNGHNFYVDPFTEALELADAYPRFGPYDVQE